MIYEELKNNKTMKTQITKVMAVAMMITASFAAQATNSKTERNLKVSAQSQKAVVLQLANLSGDTEISMYDQDGKLLFQDSAEGEAYAKTFDLRSIEAGEVYLEIENDERLEILPIAVTDNKAQIKRSAEQIIEKPIVKMNGDMAKVFFGDNESEVRVTLYDNAQDIAFRETVESETASKTYDMSKLAEGAYKMQFSANGRTFYHTIILK